MLSGDRTLDCKSACGFKLWREVCKRRLTDDEAVALIRDGATAELNGFTSVKSGKQFAARLKLNRDTWRADFDFGQQGGDAPGGTLGATLSAPCPRCNSSVRDTGKTYACEKGDFKLWKVIAQRELSENEANTLIGTGAHPVLDGFVSSKGNSFSAALELSTDFNKVNFNFEGLR